MSDSTGKDISHGLRRFQLRVGGNMGAGVQCEACRAEAQHTDDGFRKPCLRQRHNCDFPRQDIDSYPRKEHQSFAAELNFRFCKDIFPVLCYADSAKRKVK